MTKAEIYLWKLVLCDKQMLGYRFNRQRPVMNFIVDFICKELLLIIEVDGYTHLFEDIVHKDDKRQNKLESVGFKVLRYKDEDILHNIHSVITDIKNIIKEMVK